VVLHDAVLELLESREQHRIGLDHTGRDGLVQLRSQGGEAGLIGLSVAGETVDEV
jgi:hypothetical protein